ncbi:MAG: DUF1653 domain-containing protein [Oscillospiraceae bacterium]
MSLWYENAVFYSIYPIGFCGAEKFNDGGEVRYRLDKIIDWIPHLKKMEIDAVYLGPVFESVEHGYDTTDYMMIDRRLGDNASFKKICQELHKNGIRIVVDGVFNHVGRNFWAFKDVQQNGRNSRYCSWFQNLNFDGQSPCGDNFWYEGWNGHYNLVKLNMRNPETADHIINAVEMWIDEFDIDGIRLDAADCIDFDFFKRLRYFCKSKKADFWLMGEIIHGDYNRWANPEMLDSTTNYECYKGIYSSHNDKNYFEIDYSINRQFGNNGIYKNIKLFTFVDNHDVNRLASTLKNPEHLCNCYTLAYTMPGIPSIYYGSEFGIQGIHENNSDDGLRPCLDLDELNRSGNIKLFNHIVKLGRIYKAYPALRTGSYQTIIIRNQQLLFRKDLNGQTVYVALNLEDKDFDLSFNTHLNALVDVFSGQSLSINNGNAYIKMPPYSSMIIVADDIINSNDNAETEVISEVPEEILVNRKYADNKGNVYMVIAIAKNSETLEELVIYKALHGSSDVWAKPKSLFLDEGNQKFRLVD